MKDTRFARFVVIVNALVPGSILAWDALHHRNLGANPANFAVLTTGILTIVFLALTMLVTPLRKLTGLNWLYGFRRNLGLFAFFYGMAHFSLYFGAMEGWDVRATASEIWNHWYLMIGFIALLLMAPLAATSFDAVIRRMGSRQWKWLHRLVYITVVLGAIHYYMQAKSDKRFPIAFMVLFGILLAYRVAAPLAEWLRNQRAIARGEKRWSGSLRVERITQETPHVKTFRLAAIKGQKLPFGYQPGQYLTLALPIGQRMVKRSYTIASTPTRPGNCEVTIKREQPGTSSRYMHESVRVGDLIQLAAPSGQFVFTGKGERGIVMIAGGVGITPLMSMLRYLTDRAWPGAIHLVYSNKSLEDIIFRDEIENLARRHANLRVTFTLTQGGGAEWAGRMGRIDAALLRECITDLAGLPVFICGPDAMLKSMKELLPALGIPAPRIHFESFGATRAPDGAVMDVKTFEAKFSSSDKTAPAPSDLPLLDVAESVGIEIDYDCRAGVCGRCKCRLLSGAVTMAAEDALEAEEKQRGIILMCQARATENVTVEA
jgi:ferredoxin-NADP reductase/DMSO/TMAO reductase YedYZ heme-binding membrane subunit